MGNTILYECVICDSLHLWEFNGDCRDDSNRFADEEDFRERSAVEHGTIETRSWENRIDADS